MPDQISLIDEILKLGVQVYRSYGAQGYDLSPGDPTVVAYYEKVNLLCYMYRSLLD